MIGFLYSGSIVFSAMIAVIYRKYLGDRKIAILIPFLILTCIQEIVLDVNDRVSFIKSTTVVYNIYRPISAMIFSYIYFRVPFMSSVKELIKWLTIAYLLFVLVNYLFVRSINNDIGYLTIARGFLITFCAILFLFHYFNLDKIKEERFWRPLVWITAGIAIFYPVVTTSLAFQKYLAAEDVTIFGFKLYHLIPQVMSIFMYGCFSYAFYLCKKIK